MIFAGTRRSNDKGQDDKKESDKGQVPISYAGTDNHFLYLIRV